MRYTRESYFNLRPLEKYDLPVYVVTKLKHTRRHEQTPCFELQRHRAINIDRPGQTLRVPGCWGLQNLHRIDTRRWRGCQLYAPAAFTPQEISLELISVAGCLDPRVTVRPEGLNRWKIPMTPSGIETAILLLVAQCLNQLRHRVPSN